MVVAGLAGMKHTETWAPRAIAAVEIWGASEACQRCNGIKKLIEQGDDDEDRTSRVRNKAWRAKNSDDIRKGDGA